MRRHLVVTLSLFAAPALAQGRCEVGPTATQTERSSQHEWRAYASDNASSKFSLADQIDRENFESLETAWRWCSPDSDVVAANPGLWPHHYEVTPLLVDGVVGEPATTRKGAATAQVLQPGEPVVAGCGTDFEGILEGRAGQHVGEHLVVGDR